MPVASYPALAGLLPNIQRELIYKVGKKESRGGYEWRVAFWSTPRIRYTLSYNFLRMSGAGGNELDTLLAFYAARYGDWDVFNYTDPYDSVTRLCRFDMGSMQVAQLFSTIWDAKTVTFISVK